jgi:hypothetical protein
MRIGKSRLHSLGSDGLVAVSELLRLARLLCRLGRTLTVESMSQRQLESTKTSSRCPPIRGIQFYPSSQGYPISGWLAIDQPQDHALHHADDGRGHQRKVEGEARPHVFDNFTLAGAIEFDASKGIDW